LNDATNGINSDGDSDDDFQHATKKNKAKKEKKNKAKIEAGISLEHPLVSHSV